MIFSEMIEFVSRLAEVKYSQSEEMSSEPLSVKIDLLLSNLLPAFGIEKKDANVEQAEYSASDEDY
jgi:hypothetical protein